MFAVQCLEAQFYTCATTGAPLSAELTGNGPEPIGCQMANFTNDDVMSIAMNIAADERAHVNFLRTALGNRSVQAFRQLDIAGLLLDDCYSQLFCV